MSDLVEYVKWYSEQCSALRSRVRDAEAVINGLRTSGEQSVETLMETLYMLKLKVEEREAEADAMRVVIRDKEDRIMALENEKQNIKQKIEIDNADRENEI
jgi:predicted RNase H-like nuclease (RuvC/YqgF family)